jgi:hypothetical protein
MKEECVKAPRESAAHKVLTYANQLAATSEDLAERVASVLSPVVRAQKVNSESDNRPVSDCPEYPPMFASLHEYLFRINQALNGINDTIDRNEL